MTRVSIHQPNFLPWIGYFQKILASNIHIVLDDVLIPKTGGSWSNRVRVLNAGELQWLTVALKKEHGRNYTVRQMEAVVGWESRVRNVLFAAYKNAPHFDSIYSLIDNVLLQAEHSLFKFNLKFLQELFTHVTIEQPTIVIASDLDVQTTGTERLRDLVQTVKGGRYLCGLGSGSYLEPSVFDTVGIELEYVEPMFREYPQIGADSFVPGLSVIDALFNCGVDKVTELLRPSHV